MELKPLSNCRERFYYQKFKNKCAVKGVFGFIEISFDVGITFCFPLRFLFLVSGKCVKSSLGLEIIFDIIEYSRRWCRLYWRCEITSSLMFTVIIVGNEKERSGGDSRSEATTGARQPKKITTNRAIFVGVLVGTPNTNVMETERSAKHSVESRRSPNIQISSRYSEGI
ncbi:hypothetical protein C2G38_2190068 [Gigaspora rosea]|uniref:Uncharacterized protein n=1 Tax=Gigaspora rosea TaxID=44941 RepID=A0A397V1K7_9GLOM|nr:hypothetical protein C2G38_2190068 [Gigaspora rosea]